MSEELRPTMSMFATSTDWQKAMIDWQRAHIADLERQLAEALAAVKQVKSLVCGDKHPNWSDDDATYRTRGKIADVCDIATGDAPACFSVDQPTAQQVEDARDAARLKWMCERGARISHSMDGEVYSVWLPADRDGNEQRPAEGYPQKAYYTWREAIDVVMQAGKEKE